MKRLVTLTKHSFDIAKLIICAFYVIWYCWVVIFLLSYTFASTDQVIALEQGVLSILSIFLVPVLFAMVLGNEIDKWENAFLNTIYLTSITAAIVFAMFWYYFPDHNRLEPAVVLLGFSAAWTTYIRDRKITEVKELQLASKAEIVPQPNSCTLQHQIWYV
jgi:hypothetical protein